MKLRTFRIVPLVLTGLLGSACQSTEGPLQPAALPPFEDVVDVATELPAESSLESSAETPAVSKVLRVATFNTHLFFDTTCDSGQCAEGDFEQVLSQAAFEARADLLAKAIRSLGADAIALQEIENQIVLEALASRLSDLYPTTVLGETGQEGSVDVAVFSAGAFLEVRKHRYDPMVRPDGTSTYFAREFLEVHTDFSGRRVIAFSAHFRSKGSGDDPGRRLAEAQTARAILEKSAQEYPDAIIVLGGDLNDMPGSEPIAALESSPDLLRLAKDRPTQVQATYTWNGEGQAIDHLFLSTASGGVYVPASTASLWDSDKSGLADSDHAALVADLGVR